MLKKILTFRDTIANKFKGSNKTRLALPGLLLLTAFYSYRALDKQMTEAVIQKNQSVAHIKAQVLRERFDRLKDLAVSIAMRRLII